MDIDDDMDVDFDFVNDDSNDEDEEYNSRSAAIASIENLVLSFLSQLSPSLPPGSEDFDAHGDRSDTCRSGAKAKKIELTLADRRKTKADGSAGTRTLRFPLNGKAPSSKSFAQLFRVLDMMHEGLVEDIPSTKRDMYYRDVPLFKTQAVVDRLIDDVAATFDLERSDLNVRASSKGLICGSSLVIHLSEGETVSGNDSEGALIPVGEDIARFEVNDDISWVLIVEKEAVFQTLCRLRLTDHPSLPGPGIMITGKGYPDIATRQLVKTLSDNLPLNIPIMALVDGDAYGLDILSVYTHGSKSLRHENGKLAAARVEWLGLWSSELMQLGVDRDALLPITKHDEKKARALLQRPESVLPIRWKKELMHMLHTRRKAEIEILSSASSSCSAGSYPEGYHDYHDRDRNSFPLHLQGASPPLFRYVCSKISAFVASHS